MYQVSANMSDYNLAHISLMLEKFVGQIH